MPFDQPYRVSVFRTRRPLQECGTAAAVLILLCGCAAFPVPGDPSPSSPVSPGQTAQSTPGADLPVPGFLSLSSETRSGRNAEREFRQTAPIGLPFSKTQPGRDGRGPTGLDAPRVTAVFTPAEERLPAGPGPLSAAAVYPDEYLADGGDRKLPVHYFGRQRLGFDTEDTIAEYRDHSGQSHVRASSRAVIYAPRFGSVQVVESLGADVQVQQLFRAEDVTGADSMQRHDRLIQTVSRDQMSAVAARRRADGAQRRLQHGQSDQTTRAEQNRKVDQGMQTESSLAQQTFERQHGAGYHHSLASAALWTRDLYPALSASTSQATEVQARFTPQASIGLEDQRARKSHIHIVKLADRRTAETGDIIRFTIRFINTGDYDLHDVRIVDNLTPRLQFLPETVETSRAGDVLTEPNGEGSQIITFVLDDPLPAGAVGMIAFDVRVR